jgi:hypothetical protein
MKPPAPNRRSKPLNITVPPDVRAAITARANYHGLSISALLSTLAKVYCGIPIAPKEKPVEDDMKRALGRAHFMAFLEAVSDALPPGAKPLLLPQNRANHDPEAWTAGDTGILAFYAPGEANIGLLFSKATTIKAENLLARMLVVTTNASTVPAAIRQDLAAASIHIVSLADFPATVKKHVP